MAVQPVPPGALPRTGRKSVVLASVAIVGAGLLAYGNILHVPFIFDDGASIANNPTIRHLSALGEVLSPPADGEGVTSRPLVNLSLAINYAISGENPWSYHALNLAIHILAGLTLFGIVRRTLELSRAQTGSPGGVRAGS